jgi:hypothetical protein
VSARVGLDDRAQLANLESVGRVLDKNRKRECETADIKEERVSTRGQDNEGCETCGLASYNLQCAANSQAVGLTSNAFCIIPGPK